ncbi:MAG: hypothetical protein AUG51_00480 [Acidobacteria bacterium 13_1_20CM_3_53_8]|nr:MAG: hypothetical protein AUG51_00480 [Acidobacteria bacterium 13_1_20CM_3_53_8]
MSKKALSYRLFGVGKIPEQFVAALKLEGILLMDEGIKGSVTYLDFHAPGKSSSWRRQWYTASIVLTQVRLAALMYSNPIINVPFTDERIHKLQFSLEKEGETLLVAFDAGLFHNDWSGKIEYRFRTSQAQDFLKMLRERIG